MPAVHGHMLMCVSALLLPLQEATRDNNQQDGDGQAQDDGDHDGS